MKLTIKNQENMSNKRNFLEYEAPILTKYIEKNKALAAAQNAKKEVVLPKTQSANLEKKLTEQEILEAFDHDMTMTFFKRNPKEHLLKKNEAASKVPEKQNENSKSGSKTMNDFFIPKLNFHLEAPKQIEPVLGEERTRNIENKIKAIQNCKKQVFKENTNDNVEKVITENEKSKDDKIPSFTFDFGKSIIKNEIKKKTEKPENVKNETTQLENKVEVISIQNNSHQSKKKIAVELTNDDKNQTATELIITGIEKLKIQPNENQTLIQNNDKNESDAKNEEKPKQKKKKPRKKPQKKKTDSQPVVKKIKKKSAPPVKKSNKIEPEGLDSPKKPKKAKKKQTNKEIQDSNGENMNPQEKNEETKNAVDDKKPKKDFKKIHERNENLVKLNLKKQWKDRFRGQQYNYKNHYNANGRPKQPMLFGRSKIIHIKSYKIEQMLSESHLNESDPYLASLSESLKIPVLMPHDHEMKTAVLESMLPVLPSKDPIDFTDEDYLEVLKNNFGFSEFRPGQLEAIKNIINKRSTLSILQTGLGKSLIYAVCSLLLPGLTVVISPLISLMFDQIDKLPKCLPGACINGLLKPENKAKIYELIRNQKLKILYISPETLECSYNLDVGTQINFVCIDEIHCVSEWSHNFRTSYLKLSYLIKDRLKCDLILGLTATATSRTIASITQLFKINQVVKSNIINRSNLMLTTSRDQDKFPSLLSLLRTTKFKKLKSIIIYCTLIRTTENVANYLTQSGVTAIPYHSECHESTRLKIQKQFMSGEIRIVVATLAFGMGIDKKDVDGIIHLNMPKSLENYIQEVGRSGRNGKPAHCHLFLTDEDFYRIRGYVLSESLDEFSLKKLVHRILKKGLQNPEGVSSKRKGVEENEEEGNVIGKVNYILENDLTGAFECNASVLMTILLKIEEFTEGKFEIFPLNKVACNLRFFKCSPKEIEGKYEIIDKAMTISRNVNGTFHLNIIKLSNIMGKVPLELMRELQKLAMKEGLSFEMSSPAFCFRLKEEIGEEEMDNLVEYIIRKTNVIERQMLFKVNIIIYWFYLNICLD